MPKENNGVTYSFDVCCQCRNVCCQDARPPLSSSRKKILKEHLKQQGITLKEPFVVGSYSYPAVDKHLFCSLFDRQTGKCMVHPVKPETCVSGPITFDINFRTGKAEWFLKKEEICAYAGVLFRNKQALARHMEVAKKELIRLISELSAEELHAIVKIDEPQTFKVGEDDLPLEVARRLGLC